MNEVIATSTALSLFWAFFALIAMRVVLWQFDKKIGFDFGAWLKEADDVAKSIYLGARIVAVALVVGAIVS